MLREFKKTEFVLIDIFVFTCLYLAFTKKTIRTKYESADLILKVKSLDS